MNTSNYTFNFGKYKGKPYNEVLGLNPHYIYWCHQNVEWFELSENDFTILQEEIYRQNQWRNSRCRPYTCGDFGYQDDHGLGPTHILGDA